MNPIKTCALAMAVLGLAACEQKTGPANVYAADKADAGVSEPNAVGADNRVNPDSLDFFDRLFGSQQYSAAPLNCVGWAAPKEEAGDAAHRPARARPAGHAGGGPPLPDRLRP